MKSQKNLIKVLCTVAEAQLTAGACGTSTQSLLDSLAVSRDSSAETVVNARNFNAFLKGCVTDGAQSVFSFDQSRMRFDQRNDGFPNVELEKLPMVPLEDVRRALRTLLENADNKPSNSSDGCSTQQTPSTAVATGVIPGPATSTSATFSQTVVVEPPQGTTGLMAARYTPVPMPSNTMVVGGTPSESPVYQLCLNSGTGYGNQHNVNVTPAYPSLCPMPLNSGTPNQGGGVTNVLVSCGTFLGNRRNYSRFPDSPRHFSDSTQFRSRSGVFNSNSSSCGITVASDSTYNSSM